MPDLNLLLKNYPNNSSKIVYVSTLKSPVGEIIAAADDEYLYTATFEDSKVFEKTFKTLHEELSCSFKQEKNEILNLFEHELQSYFDGSLKKFTVPLKSFGSDFQKDVWNQLLEVPYGSTQTYADLAKALGRPATHSRAVGGACGANPHLLVVPCHRLISSGSKGGFNGGVDRKELLLEHEKKYSNTAYFGVKEICYPKAGETIAITGAAGAVGSHVGQIGKILGCRVIGFAGTDEKCEYLKKELGFDHAYNYKTANIKAALREGAPNRVDCYFDNVGGEISSTIMGHMNKYGRVAVCGSISSYNDTALPKVTILQPAIVFKELKVEGFLVNRWLDRWDEGINANTTWLRDGKIKYQEKVYHGFENMVDALVGILRGENTGKAVVKVK